MSILSFFLAHKLPLIVGSLTAAAAAAYAVVNYTTSETTTPATSLESPITKNSESITPVVTPITDAPAPVPDAKPPVENSTSLITKKEQVGVSTTPVSESPNEVIRMEEVNSVETVESSPEPATSQEVLPLSPKVVEEQTSLKEDTSSPTEIKEPKVVPATPEKTLVPEVKEQKQESIPPKTPVSPAPVPPTPRSAQDRAAIKQTIIVNYDQELQETVKGKTDLDKEVSDLISYSTQIANSLKGTAQISKWLNNCKNTVENKDRFHMNEDEINKVIELYKQVKEDLKVLQAIQTQIQQTDLKKLEDEANKKRSNQKDSDLIKFKNKLEELKKQVNTIQESKAYKALSDKKEEIEKKLLELNLHCNFESMIAINNRASLGK